MSAVQHGQRLLAIQTTQEVINEYTTKLAMERARRDALILDALIDNTPYRTIQQLTGLSRSALIKIQNSPRPRVDIPEFGK